MQVHVDKVTDGKTGQYGFSCKLWSGRDFYYVNEDATQYIGKNLEVDVTDKGKYKIGKILSVIPGAAASSNGNGGITWDAYENMARLAHRLAKELEPDDWHSANLETGQPEGIDIDRSTARAAILNTVMIAFSNGKISLSEEESPF